MNNWQLPLTYRQLYRKYCGQLGDLTTRRLLCYVSRLTAAELLREFDTVVTPELAARFESVTARSLKGEHEAYITGEWEFYGLPFYITPDVLIPRVDTEELTAAAIELLRGRQNARILDLCCGSGCIGIAIAARLDCELTAADISEKALELTRRNAERNGVKLKAIQCNALTENPLSGEHFDLLISNPPYLQSAEIAELNSSVRDFEPRLALDGGSGGLDFYTAISSLWTGCAENIIVECAIGQSAEVRRLLPNAHVIGTGTDPRQAPAL
ncbi:MAG: peptide chain release factor N(5)-glutamine methyltransferase [Oscillospiraceae bacterium]|jgi:release factor glutamine methyltransferase|nr:peptide chain release factor N(5)-glutamine methyltransferase [Oscillospiraceae bacterium]